MGSLTDRKCVQGQRVSGILIKRNFNYHIVTPSDLSSKCLCMFCFAASLNTSLCVVFRCCGFPDGFPPSVCSDYTDLSMGTVTQTQAIPYTGPISLLVSQLRSLAGESTTRNTAHIHIYFFSSEDLFVFYCFHVFKLKFFVFCRVMSYIMKFLY